jgi:hypothetical protein
MCLLACMCMCVCVSVCVSTNQINFTTKFIVLEGTGHFSLALSLLLIQSTGLYCVDEPNLQNKGEKLWHSLLTALVTTFNSVNKWFKVNLLSIKVEKTHYIQFKTKNKPTLDINIVCNDNLITTLPKIKFLGIYISDSI